METDNLIENYQNLIWKIAQKFYGVDKEDLFQAGALGLLKAKRNYKASCGTKFSSYAVSYIFGEMYLLVTNKNLKYSKDMLKLYKLIEQTRYNLAQKLNKIPSNEEVAIFLEMPINDIDYACMVGVDIMSLDNTNEEERSIYEQISIDSGNIDDHILIEEGLSLLDASESEIIRSRYFEDLTQAEIAKKLQMTQVMVSRYEKRGKEKMRAFMTM